MKLEPTHKIKYTHKLIDAAPDMAHVLKTITLCDPELGLSPESLKLLIDNARILLDKADVK